MDGKAVYGKNVNSGKTGNKKVSGFLVDFALFLLLLFIKCYKERFGIYFLKLH